ncbi:hypothetical protein H0N96_00280 [Candidatus Micrarchaeota archaeon]|nr:hypothetical protein [Candidatus Micrarchaeota archaeon]
MPGPYPLSFLRSGQVAEHVNAMHEAVTLRLQQHGSKLQQARARLQGFTTRTFFDKILQGQINSSREVFDFYRTRRVLKKHEKISAKAVKHFGKLYRTIGVANEKIGEVNMPLTQTEATNLMQYSNVLRAKMSLEFLAAVKNAHTHKQRVAAEKKFFKRQATELRKEFRVMRWDLFKYSVAQRFANRVNQAKFAVQHPAAVSKYAWHSALMLASPTALQLRYRRKLSDAKLAKMDLRVRPRITNLRMAAFNLQQLVQEHANARNVYDYNLGNLKALGPAFSRAYLALLLKKKS